jgi:hypothetical protein
MVTERQCGLFTARFLGEKTRTTNQQKHSERAEHSIRRRKAASFVIMYRESCGWRRALERKGALLLDRRSGSGERLARTVSRRQPWPGNATSISKAVKGGSIGESQHRVTISATSRGVCCRPQDRRRSPRHRRLDYALERYERNWIRSTSSSCCPRFSLLKA